MKNLKQIIKVAFVVAEIITVAIIDKYRKVRS